MKHILYPLALAAGFMAGWSDFIPASFPAADCSHLLLYILVIQVGIGLGIRRDLRGIFSNFSFKLLLLPLFTIAGTLAFTYLASFLLRQQSTMDVMAIGSGFGYYSLSSVLIAQFKTASEGIEVATALAAIAILTNIIRELIALISCHTLARSGHGYAAISVAGINSMDVCLPMILADKNDRQLVSAALIHGIILEISVPILIAFFCR